MSNVPFFVTLTFVLQEPVTPDYFARRIGEACAREGSLRAGEAISLPSDPTKLLRVEAIPESERGDLALIFRTARNEAKSPTAPAPQKAEWNGNELPPVYWNELPPEKRPSLTFNWAVTLTNVSSVVYYLVTKEDWCAVPANPSCERTLEAIPNERKAVFYSIKDFLTFCALWEVTLIDSAEGMY